MNTAHKLLLACIPLAALAACGGGDTGDRLDLANPTVRFIHASPLAPNLTLYRGTTAQTDENNAPYRFASNYFDIDMSTSDWLVKTTVGALTLGTETISPGRGDKYTIVALATSAVTTGTYLIADPYNKSVTTDKARLRVLNASYNAANIDLYMNAIGVDIRVPGVNPTIAATAFQSTGPVSGSDSIELAASTYQVTITPAGTKTVLFQGRLSFGANEDLLLLSVPDSVVPGAIKALVKVERTVGLTEVPAS